MYAVLESRDLYEGLEISICDDGSPVPVVAPECIVTRLPAKTIGLNPCVPINAAVRASSGDIVVLTNPEIEHREDVLAGMLALLEGPDDYVTVSCRDVNGMWLAGQNVDYTKNGRLPVPKGAHFHFCAMLTRELFERVGGFDEEYRNGRACEDNDWLWSLDHAGANFKLAPGVVWHHQTPHAYGGTHESNRDRLLSRWGHKWK
jgi:GT2 family glycosyltransferase